MRPSLLVALCLAGSTSASAQGGIAVSLFAAPHQGSGSQASVLIGVELEDLRTAGVDLHYDIIGPPVALPGRPVTVTEHGGRARVLTRHSLMPGAYRLRVAVTERGSGRTGFVTSEIEVPDLTPGLQRLAMSEALLTASRVSGPTQVDVEDDAALPVLGLPPTTRRTFSRDEKLEVHAEFYEQPSQIEFDTQLTVTTRLLAEDGRVVFETSDTGTSEELTGSRWGYAHSTLVPIATVEPGRYAVQVIGETLYDVPASVARSIPITVVATPSEQNP